MATGIYTAETVEPLNLRTRDAAKVTGLRPTKLKELIASGEIKTFRSGRARLIPVASIREWIEREVAAQNDGGGVASR